LIKRCFTVLLAAVIAVLALSTLVLAQEVTAGTTGGDELAAAEALIVANLKAKVVEFEALPVCYVAGTVNEMDEMFGLVVQAAKEQGLLNEETEWGTVYPTVLTEEFTEESVVYAGISLPEDATPEEPLLPYTIPGGHYLMVQHWGDYAQLPQTWEQALIWAKLKGVETGTGPCFEHYVTDPDTTPVEEWLTEIFIPVIVEDAPTAVTTD